MISSETIEIIHSNIVIVPIYSDEDPDYRQLIEVDFRLLETEGIRNLEDDENKRLLE